MLPKSCLVVFLETDTEVINSLSESRRVRYDIVTALWSKCHRLAAGRILKRRAYSEFLFQDKNSIWWEWVKHFCLGWSRVKAPASTGRENSWALETTTFLKHPRLCWGVRDSAIPQLAHVWQHWKTMGGLAASTSLASWLDVKTWGVELPVHEFCDCFQSCWTTTSPWESELRTDVVTALQTVVFTFWQIDEEHRADKDRKAEME